MDLGSFNQIVEWLNNAQLQDSNEKLILLAKITEVLVNKEPNLLADFFDHIVVFQLDSNAEVRRAVLTFYEQSGEKHHRFLPRILPNLLTLLNDPNLQTQKKVIQVSTNLYKELVMWISERNETSVDDDLSSTWNDAELLKKRIINLVDSDHDGIRNQTVKFMEVVVILQTRRDSEDTEGGLISIYDVPLMTKLIQSDMLRNETREIFDLLVNFRYSQNISSTSLTTYMSALTAIALSRSSFFGKVIEALETVHTHLPPNLSESQVSVVRKLLKRYLLSLMKLPASSNYQHNIMTLLTDLGATHSEVVKNLPMASSDDRKRKYKKYPESIITSKKQRQDDVSPIVPPPPPVSGIDLTETWIHERLLPSIAAQIIMETLPNLPSRMPSLFNAAYTPIAAAGTPAQVKHVSRLLATQLHAAGLGPYVKDDKTLENGEMKPKAMLMPTILKPSLRTPHILKLSEVTKPLEVDTRDDMAIDAVKRILAAEHDAANGGALRARLKIITSIATTFGVKVRQAILDYILEDVRQRLGLALAWLYEEYSILQGFYKLPSILQHDKQLDHNYNTLLCSLALAIIEKPDSKDSEALFHRLYLEAPLITDYAFEILKNVSAQEVSAVKLLQALVLKRPAKQIMFLNTLLAQTSHHATEINKTAIKHVLELYSNPSLCNIINEYAQFYLGLLKMTSPPDVLFGAEKGITKKSDKWTETEIKCCLRLYLALLPYNQDLIHELAEAFAETDLSVKRIILRLIEGPVQKMGMSSPQLMKLVDSFPKGADTLVSRVLHIFTDKQLPNQELVDKVRELYQSRVSDVRFLIPVLQGLSKNEICNALPDLIKLNPNVVKEIFNRMMGQGGENSTSPINPAELLVALHKIDTNQCELKYTIKATSLCFADKKNFTQEVLAVVIQSLMDITPLPTLLMRTVIQALSYYPRLIGFGMNILQRLIQKQVWSHAKVWEGFIKCCERTKPNSFQVLLQLPAEQLQSVFKESPDLKPALLEHVMTYNEVQRSHIPQAIMDILHGIQAPVYNDFVVKNEPVSPPELTIDIKEEPQEEGSTA